MHRRSAARSAIALAALVVGLEPLLVRSLGSRAPGWSHWWCSASSASATSHATGASWLGGALHTTLEVLAVHWPHFLPILLALGTLVYLWRADAQHRACSHEQEHGHVHGRPAGGDGIRAPLMPPTAGTA